MQTDQIIIYQTTDGQTAIDVKLENETIWLTQAQIVSLFKSSKANISEHLKHIYSTGELEETSTVRKFRTVQKEGIREITRESNHYNLDAIISLGYRVNSKRGTQFRIWANKVLKEYLIKGYSINEKRLKDQAEQLADLKNTVALLSNVIENKELTSDEATGLLKVVTDYTYALDILDKYDHQQLTIEGTTPNELFILNYIDAKHAIHDLKDKFGGSMLFGNEKDDSFQGSIGAIYQTFWRR
ncbi:virulence RhuM family protein [Pedobacter psychroterrae]|uniref:virulence RhuM family protein n=1 Tax=Pedobacter psychroterrae TaxID=2530453 RepID=UPI00198013D9|nr:RhuM family protein [Pedobacter psychroterrae]